MRVKQFEKKKKSMTINSELVPGGMPLSIHWRGRPGPILDETFNFDQASTRKKTGVVEGCGPQYGKKITITVVVCLFKIRTAVRKLPRPSYHGTDV